jgi:hypothetical protein
VHRPPAEQPVGKEQELDSTTYITHYLICNMICEMKYTLRRTSVFFPCSTVPFGSNNQARPASTCFLNLTFQKGYWVSVSSSSDFGHLQIGHLPVPHRVAAAISAPSMRRKCQNRQPLNLILLLTLVNAVCCRMGWHASGLQTEQRGLRRT